MSLSWLARDDSYRVRHEAFVSNKEGAPLWDVMRALSYAAPLLLCLKSMQAKQSPSLLRDFLIGVFPLLLLLTVLSGHDYILVLVCVASVVVFVASRYYYHIMPEFGRDPPGRVAALSYFRGGNMLLTCICILAVDFQVFPRSMAKTEGFGLGLMDIGVGSFIVSSAFTSSYARGTSMGTSNSNSNGGSTSVSSTTSVGSGGGSRALCQVNLFKRKFDISSHLLNNLAVIAFGVGRLVIVRMLNYQSPNTEYGNDWNFFVTLFFVWVIADLAHYSLQRRTIIMSSLALLIAYQYVLLKHGLTDYILHGDRTDFLSANREGIASLLGCVPLYLLSESISTFLFFSSTSTSTASKEDSDPDEVDLPTMTHNILTAHGITTTSGSASTTSSSTATAMDYNSILASIVASSSSSSSYRPRSDSNSGIDIAREKFAELMSHSSFFKHDTSELRKTLSKTVGIGLLSSLVWWISSRFFQQTSRRLYNLSFVALLVLVSMYMLALIICVELITSGRNIHVRTLDLLNRHQLAVFLIANVLTGAINLTIPTMDASTTTAITILSVYLFIVTASPWVIERFWPSTPISKPPRQKP